MAFKLQYVGSAVNHYAAVVLGEGGRKVRGFDYLNLEDAERQQERLAAEGRQSEVWAMNAYGERVHSGERHGRA